jgi:hypothetical protein
MSKLEDTIHKEIYPIKQMFHSFIKEMENDINQYKTGSLVSNPSFHIDRHKLCAWFKKSEKGCQQLIEICWQLSTEEKTKEGE